MSARTSYGQEVVGVRRLVTLVLGVLLLVGGPPVAAAPGRDRAVTPCSRGLVALTFDDGPSPTVTPRLVRLLGRLEVPATFFMVGTRVAAHPGLARQVSDAGFAIGNHTWEHADLTSQSRAEIRRALRDTRHALAEAGAPAPTLTRPPYGAIDDRVRRVLAAAGYTPVLWTIDSRDWSGGTPRQIARRVTTQVRPHRTNVVLQHDGVTHSPATLRALPREVAALRRRGFCFAPLDAEGRPTPPVPVASVSAEPARVREGDRVRVTVRLDRPTSRPTTALVASGGSATWGVDVVRPPRRVRFGVGDQVARFWMRTRADALDEPAEDLTFKVFGGRGVQPALVTQGLVRIADDDPGAVVDLVGAAVRTSPLLETSVRLGVRLDRVSGWDVRVTISTPAGRRALTVPAGSHTAGATIALPPGTPTGPVRNLPLRLVRVRHAEAGAAARLVVRPPTQTRAEAVREALGSVRWPNLRLPALFG